MRLQMELQHRCFGRQELKAVSCLAGSRLLTWKDVNWLFKDGNSLGICEPVYMDGKPCTLPDLAEIKHLSLNLSQTYPAKVSSLSGYEGNGFVTLKFDVYGERVCGRFKIAPPEIKDNGIFIARLPEKVQGRIQKDLELYAGFHGMKLKKNPETGLYTAMEGRFWELEDIYETEDL